ncbi:MAG: hypothetical protein LBG14_07445 [Treponema sp.]|jgi:hypothetical protein|nr:hypothetical protein [Treponema sp.]
MAAGHDFIPAKDADFDPWFKNLCDYVTKMTAGNPPAWTHIPPGEVTALTGARGLWHTAYEAVLKPHSPVETEAKNDARAAAEDLIRPFKRRYLDDPPVTGADRTAMGLPLRDGTRTPDKKPETYPEAETDSSVIRQLGIRFKDRGAANRAKPHGVHGAEIRWNIQDQPPADIEAELIHSDFDTASPFTITFGEADRGKRVYYALRWESITNLKGGWSEVYSAIIP